MNALRSCFLTVAALLLTAGCATTQVDSSILDNANYAISQAEAAGGQEYAPLELRFARESVAMAETLLADNGNGDSIRRLADEAEIEAQLALARTRSALARAERDAAAESLRALEQDLVDTFGEEVLEE